MTSLSRGQLSALRNLDRKLRLGSDVGWINIADAQFLTALGFAERKRGSWQISAAGVSELSARAETCDHDPERVVFHDFGGPPTLSTGNQRGFDADPTLPS